MQQTKTTVHLKLPDPRAWSTPAATAIVVFCLLGIAAIVGSLRSAPSVAAVPTPGLVIMIATPMPAAIAAPVEPVTYHQPAPPAGNVTRRAIVVYGAADLGTAIGAVEPGRAFTPLAHWGAEWMQIDMAGSGVVFVRVGDLYDIPANLVDLQPPAAPVVIDRPVYVAAPQPAYVEQPSYQVTNSGPPAPVEPPSAPAVEQPAVVAAPVPTPAPQEPNAAPDAVMPFPDTSTQRHWNQIQLCAEHAEWHC